MGYKRLKWDVGNAYEGRSCGDDLDSSTSISPRASGVLSESKTFDPGDTLSNDKP